MPAPTISARKSRSRAPRPAALKRLSVAVVLRDVEGSKPRSPVEIQQITDLVRSAVGADTARNDQVTVISRKFAPAAATGGGPAFYESGWFAMIVRNVTALVIALLVLFLGVRPLSKALLKKRDDAGRGWPRPGGARHRRAGRQRRVAGPVGIDALESAQNFDDRHRHGARLHPRQPGARRARGA